MTRESRNPANDDTLTGCFKEVLRKFLQNTDDMLPGMVQDYDRTTNLARVQPLIQIVDTANQTHNRAPVANIPVLLLGGGSFFISFNLPAGSLGWIKANDRDISLFLQGFVNNRPNTERMHNFSDAVFIPDIMTGYTIDSDDADAMVIQNLDGTVKIALSETAIDMVAPAVNVTTTGNTTFQVSGEFILNGNMRLRGNILEAGNILTQGNLLNNGVNVGSTHTHTQPPDSAGDTEADTGPPK